jgi:large-conductance mechanosensitive channel
MDIINPISFRDKFGKFIVDNGIAGTAAGVSIAVSTKELITSFVGDILIPLIYLLLIRINVTSVKILPAHAQINGMTFVQHSITWVLVIIITFLFIQYFFKNILGISGDTKADKKQAVGAGEGFGTLY